MEEQESTKRSLEAWARSVNDDRATHNARIKELVEVSDGYKKLLNDLKFEHKRAEARIRNEAWEREQIRKLEQQSREQEE